MRISEAFPPDVPVTMPAERKDRYAAYLRSGAWDVKRWGRLVFDDFRCQVCGREANAVHHLTYLRIYQEANEDLVSLCTACHEAVTELAKTWGQAEAVDTLRRHRAKAGADAA